MKFGNKWRSSFKGDVVWNCGRTRTDAGAFPSLIFPLGPVQCPHRPYIGKTLNTKLVETHLPACLAINGGLVCTYTESYWQKVGTL